MKCTFTYTCCIAGYDNWLVVHSIMNNIPSIDSTPTVVAIHQTGHDGNMAGHSNRKNKYINYGLAGKHFDYSLGWTSCTHFVTQWNGTEVELFHRKRRKEDKNCVSKYKRKVRNPYIYSDWKISWGCIHIWLNLILQDVVTCDGSYTFNPRSPRPFQLLRSHTPPSNVYNVNLRLGMFGILLAPNMSLKLTSDS